MEFKTTTEFASAQNSALVDITAHLQDVNDYVHNLVDTIRRLEEENSSLRNGIDYDLTNHPENYKIYGYSLLDLFALAEKCAACAIMPEDLHEATRSLELALEVVHRDFEKTYARMFTGSPFINAHNVTVNIGGKKDGPKA